MWFDHLKGVQLTPENASDVAKWINGEVIHVQKDGTSEPRLTMYTPRGDVLVCLGDWVAQDEDGRFRVIRIDDIDLAKMFDRAKVDRRTVLSVGVPRKA